MAALLIKARRRRLRATTTALPVSSSMMIMALCWLCFSLSSSLLVAPPAMIMVRAWTPPRTTTRPHHYGHFEAVSSLLTGSRRTTTVLSLFPENKPSVNHQSNNDGEEEAAAETTRHQHHPTPMLEALQRNAVGAMLAAALILVPVAPLPSQLLLPLQTNTAAQATVLPANTENNAAPPPVATTTTGVSSIMLSAATPTISGEDIVDETWTLIDKYYIDRTFNNQNWNAVRTKYKSLAKKSRTDTVKLVAEMVATLGDKYSRILDPDQYTAIQKYDLIGVGATLMPDENKEIMVGAPPIAGSAADRAGLQVGDHVTAINGITTTGRTAFDIIDQIAENPNAETITMTIVKKDDFSSSTPQPEVYTLQRQFQQVKNPIFSKITERRADGTVVAFVRISEFNSLVKARLEQALRELEDAGANAYVLDLRHNTGGAFQSAVEISSLFVSDRVATYVVDNSEKQLPFKTASNQVVVDTSDPLVLWIDGYSASASEVLAGSLHDNCRAVIMGSEKSFGKGLIQAVYGLKNGAGLVLTVANYVTPAGNEIQGVGIAPDIKANLPLPVPGLLSDTSKVDFGLAKSRLDPSFCKVPSNES